MIDTTAIPTTLVTTVLKETAPPVSVALGVVCNAGMPDAPQLTGSAHEGLISALRH